MDVKVVILPNTTKRLLRRRIDPRHHPRRVEDIARNTDTVESPCAYNQTDTTTEAWLISVHGTKLDLPEPLTLLSWIVALSNC